MPSLSAAISPLLFHYLTSPYLTSTSHRSQESDFWDAKLLEPRYHRFLSSALNQALFCDRLAEQGLKADVKPLSVNLPVGEDLDGAQTHWVSLVTMLLTLTIWEPVGAPQHHASGSATHPLHQLPYNVGGGGAAHLGSPTRRGAPVLLRSPSDLTADDPVDSSSPVRRTLSTGWARTVEE